MIRDNRDDDGEKDDKDDKDDKNDKGDKNDNDNNDDNEYMMMTKMLGDIYWSLSLSVSRLPGQPHMVHNDPVQTKFQNLKKMCSFSFQRLWKTSTPRMWCSNLQELC